MAEATGLNATTVSTPKNTAAPAAGKMKRQAETPAARMAISSLLRFRLTKAPSTPNRKANGSSRRMTVGDSSSARPSTCTADTSLARTPTVRDSSTKLLRRMMVEITASAMATPNSVRVST